MGFVVLKRKFRRHFDYYLCVCVFFQQYSRSFYGKVRRPGSVFAYRGIGFAAVRLLFDGRRRTVHDNNKRATVRVRRPGSAPLRRGPTVFYTRSTPS